ncbi:MULTISPECIES: hypothetical protein [unclassified Mesorhizobium]|uniref:hypothetical protein n=1 Tax=unclassified Mesorhizobium TaxID=325217 RepID=UPI00112A344E|nr:MULTISPECIES: hypothetical protein [unclassified Mesorhizobium]TPK42263.1 hypothetical protein FJ550_29960 [Mesorhizobium sp. B2-5-2]TPL44542.1 hypothetical protein FJ961_04180 [Mesorhizobium sp. B2-4-5]TPM68729.1 hypothetical protein FJ968_29985 [Mesorhizobium sp. B2-1-6]TPN71711.1 hypothetical protein FJ985_30465 [Mesorhizobium sp. B1-1-2]
MSIEALIKELRAHASWRAENQGPFTKENLLEWRAADLLASIQADNLRLKAALAPFAEARGHFDGHVRDDDIVPGALRHIRARHVIAAARSLSQAVVAHLPNEGKAE